MPEFTKGSWINPWELPEGLPDEDKDTYLGAARAAIRKARGEP